MAKKRKKRKSRKLYGAALAAHNKKVRGRKGGRKSGRKGHSRIEREYYGSVKRMREAGRISRTGRGPFLMGHGRKAKSKSERAVARRHASASARRFRKELGAQRAAQIAADVDAIRYRNLVRQFGESRANEIWAAQKERARLRTVTAHSR